MWWFRFDPTLVPMLALLCVAMRRSAIFEATGLPQHVCWETLASMGNNAVFSQDDKLLRRRADAEDAAGGTPAKVPGRRAVCTAAGIAEDSRRRDAPSMVRLVEVHRRQIWESLWTK